ncbi:glycosyl hydrolase family 8 [Nodosilinea sp. PGN35]|uniref:glycosyl hydrolase family 8 n=1 Tax=Nodosilinea sp. PGN35 TaxID=3020489 RepID=UPI0023B28E11|nr:glycosyl hydrolase family 8 [Nodosilinea sp. TSF1-S3]MDF0365915.1 glycosyl hydrolase family 8 [Nodosilinea sp. TSF1-S3]
MMRLFNLRRSQTRLLLSVLPLALVLLAATPSCTTRTAACACLNPENGIALELPVNSPQNDLLIESWQAYRSRFIQDDGRVIDREDGDRTVSEGQAYAMLRAVAVNDPATFDRTYTWAKSNLARLDEAGEPTDLLWAWKWGQRPDGSWDALDPNFATDADIDAATALILAARRWSCPQYLDDARALLADIWNHGTLDLPNGNRQLIPGPAEAFSLEPDQIILNPSYFAPASFRLFAEVDPDHDWNSLIDSGYTLLSDLSEFSATGLPPDWIAYNPATGTYRQLPLDYPLQSRYSFDAFRVWWRVAQDAVWFNEPRAQAYLEGRTPELIRRWQQNGRLPARLTLDGNAEASFEATAHYAMVYLALTQVDPAIADEILREKLQPVYSNGFWDNDTAYYTQNLAWFGLLPLDISPDRLQSTAENLCQSQE